MQLKRVRHIYNLQCVQKKQNKGQQSFSQFVLMILSFLSESKTTKSKLPFLTKISKLHLYVQFVTHFTKILHICSFFNVKMTILEKTKILIKIRNNTWKAQSKIDVTLKNGKGSYKDFAPNFSISQKDDNNNKSVVNMCIPDTMYR